jgi:TolB-like protein
VRPPAHCPAGLAFLSLLIILCIIILRIGQNMKRYGIAAALFTLLLASVMGQDLHGALKKTAEYLEERLPSGTIVAIISIKSEHPRFSEYVIDELVKNIVNRRKLLVVERRRLDVIREEMDYQMSGEVSEESARSIGQQLGARMAVTGSLTPMGNEYVLRVQAVNVETAAIEGIDSRNVRLNRTQRTSLLENERTPQTARSSAPRRKWLYLGARAGGSKRTYTFPSGLNLQTGEDMTFEAAAEIEIRPVDFLLFQGEFIYAVDKVHAGDTADINAASAAIPVLLRFNFNLIGFEAALFGGPYFVFPLGEMMVWYEGRSDSYPFTAGENIAGITGGGSLGLKMLGGVVYADLRYLADLYFVRANRADRFSRSAFSFTFGYRFALF